MGAELGTGAAESRPNIPYRLQPYWSSFVYLHKRRQWFEGGPQPISMEAVKSYVDLGFRVAPEQIRRFLRFVDALDDVFLSNYAEGQKNKNKPKSGSKKP